MFNVRTDSGNVQNDSGGQGGTPSRRLNGVRYTSAGKYWVKADQSTAPFRRLAPAVRRRYRVRL